MECGARSGSSQIAIHTKNKRPHKLKLFSSSNEQNKGAGGWGLFIIDWIAELASYLSFPS